MGKLKLTKLKSGFGFRKIAMASWRTVGDPQVYAHVELDMEPAMKFLEEYRKRTGLKASPMHLVAKALAYVFKKRPEVNGMIRGGRIWLRENVSIFFLVNMPGREPGQQVNKADLSGCTLHEADKKSLKEIVQFCDHGSSLTRESKNPEISKITNLINFLPWFAVRWALDIVSFLNYGLNLDLRMFGMPKDPFGSVMITNVGALGIDQAWGPLTPHSRVPIFMSVGAVHKRPWVVNDEIVVRQMMSVGVTFDHRFMDGAHAAEMYRLFKICFENPEIYLNDLTGEELIHSDDQSDLAAVGSPKNSSVGKSLFAQTG